MRLQTRNRYVKCDWWWWRCCCCCYYYYYYYISVCNNFVSWVIML